MSIKLSVIIPTYNRASYLSQCLHSILSSSYENLEVIVSDNASQDDTQAVVSSFTDNRLRYYRNDTNIGAELNILKLVEYASDGYIFCLGDDDFLNEGAISEIIEMIHRNPGVGVILSALNRLDARTDRPFSDYVPYPHSRLFNSGEESLVALLWVARSFPTITIRRDLIDIDGAKRHVDSMYPQVYLVGSAMKRAPTYYTDKRLVTGRLYANRWWEYKSQDYLMLSKIDLVRDLLPDPNDTRCLDILIGQIVRSSIYGVLSESRGQSMKAFLRQTFSLLGMPEVRKSRFFWMNSFLVLGTNSLTRAIWRKLPPTIKSIVS